MQAGSGGCGRARLNGARLNEQIALEKLPFATVLFTDGVAAQANPAFVDLLGWSLEDVVGLTAGQFIERYAHPADRATLESGARERAELRAGRAPQGEARQSGTLWVRMLTRDGGERALRIDWRGGTDGRQSFLFFTDAEAEAFGKRFTERLARAAGALVDGNSDTEILERAAEALAGEGLICTLLLIDRQDPLLRFGPTRVPASVQRLPPRSLQRPPVSLLREVNPRFDERAAAFIFDGRRLVREAYPEAISSELLHVLPTTRMVQAPLFVGARPYGAMVVSGNTLTPMLGTAIELFAELVGHALANLQLRRERVERERLAALGEAAAVMAHEVRNPVAAIGNALALLRATPRGGVMNEHLFEIISEETTRLDQLVNQLFELGRPLAPRPEAHPLLQLATASAKLLETRQESPVDRVTIEGTTADVVRVDRHLAELAVTNVLRNAVQSAGEHGHVVVHFERTENERALVVEDDGPGFAPEVLARAGEPFTTTRATGTGMGLAVVRRVLDALGGRVEIGTSAAGGARVALWFPAA
jgi:two-component system sensor histidine kinase HydH